jgi:methyl-accepting chemotaxis protein
MWHMVNKNLIGKLANLGVAGKVNIALVVIITILSITSGFFIVTFEEQALNTEVSTARDFIESIQDEQIEATNAAVTHKVEQLSKLLAAIAPQPMIEFELAQLSTYAEMAVEDPDVAFVRISNVEGKTYAQAGQEVQAHEMIQQDIAVDDEKLGTLQVGYNFLRSEEKGVDILNKTSLAFQDIEFTKQTAIGHTVISTVVIFGLIILVSSLLAAFMLKRLVTRPLAEVVDAAGELASGNLTQRVSTNSHDEVGSLSHAFNNMAEQFGKMISEVADTSRHLNESSANIGRVMTSASDGVKRQQTETDQVATAMNQMLATVQEVAQAATRAADHTRNATESSHEGKRVVEETVAMTRQLADEVEKSSTAITELEQHVGNIGAVIDVIKGVAEQTNLLALNAAIEAARAGEQGRGFAVVADEVRTLAQRTQESTQEIEDMILRVQSGTRHVVEVMESGRQRAQAGVVQATSAGNSLDAITSTVQEINDLNAHIASATEEQTSVADEMNRNILVIRQVAEETADGAQQAARELEELNQMADGMEALVGRFRV